MAADTGQGAVLLLETTGDIGCPRSLQLPEWVMEKVESDCLATVGFGTYVTGDLTDPGEIVAEVVFDSELPIPEGGVVETVTITFRLSNPANTTAAVLSGTGFITSRALPNLIKNELNVMTVTIAFDGYTGPAFTPESA